VLRFEVAPETFALFREAMVALRRSVDDSLDDDAALLALARLALGGPRDEGRSSYQIAVTVCAECGRGQQLANGELVPIGPDMVAMAHCDGQHIGCITPRAANDSTPPRCSEPKIDAHVGAAPLENPRASASVPTRAKQATPPALRRAVLARDHRRCRVPGCRNDIFLDVHHLELRSEGGRNDADNLITLCGAHHRAAHRGRLTVEGSATAMRFRHADGSVYGRVMDAQALEARAKTFRALCGLGFREGEVRAVLAQLEGEGKLAAATTEQWLRAGLARLTPRRTRP
jgi:hypothetical protein